MYTYHLAQFIFKDYSPYTRRMVNRGTKQPQSFHDVLPGRWITLRAIHGFGSLENLILMCAPVYFVCFHAHDRN